MRARILAAALPLVLAACKMGPDYHRPASDIPEEFRFQMQGARDAANEEWWRQFHDPALDALVDTALSNSWTLQIAAGQIEQAAGVLMSTRSGLYPQLGYVGGARRDRFSERQGVAIPPGTPNPQNLFAGVLDASWEVDLWGRIRRQTESAEAGLVGAEEARRGVVLSLVSSVAASYIQLRSLDEQLEASQRTLKVYADTLTLFTNQHKYGEVSMLNVEQARAQYEGAAATIPQLEQQIAQAEDALSLLIGRNPGAIVRGRRLDELKLPRVPAALPSELLERRPDVAQAEQNLIAANAQIGAAKALYFPTISLTGAFGWASDQLKHLFIGPAQVWTFAGSAIGPIFTGGNISGQVIQAEAVQKQTLAGYQQTIQIAFADVADALVGYQKGLQTVAANERLVKALRTNVQLAWYQYREGYEPYLTVLTAEQQLYSAEIATAQTRGNTYVSLVDIYKALGGGWVAAATNATPRPRTTPSLVFP